MTEEMLVEILSQYNVHSPTISFIRHNENRTYKVTDADGQSFLLRIHQPFKEGMTGLQHTYYGLLEELNMLDAQKKHGRMPAYQTPLRNHEGQWITTITNEGSPIHCSLLTWLDGRDLRKEDMEERDLVRQLGSQIAELHDFFRDYESQGMEHRPSQDIEYNESLIAAIKTGAELGLFKASDVITIERCIQLINDRLKQIGKTRETWGMIHGDLGMGNVIMTTTGTLSFIDYGFFGSGYYSTDVAMGALMVPPALRDVFLEGVYGCSRPQDEERILLEGMMLISILGFYAFHMGNEKMYEWMQERLPKLCTEHCLPYLSGESIFYRV